MKEKENESDKQLVCNNINSRDNDDDDKLSLVLHEPSGTWSSQVSPVSVVLSGWESLTPSGRDTNLSHVSS